VAKLRYIVLACVALGGVLLYLLSRASSNTAVFAEHYTLLLVLNVLLAAVLIGLIGYQVWLVKKRIRDKVFGARLTMRLIIMFALMAVVPGTLIYAVSVQFLTRSIESWFDVRVDNALEGGMGLGRSVLEAQQIDLVRKAQAIAITLQEEPPGSHMRQLDQMRINWACMRRPYSPRAGRCLPLPPMRAMPSCRKCRGRRFCARCAPSGRIAASRL